MKKQRLTIAALAERAGIAVGTVQKLVNDPNCNPTIASLEGICQALGTSVSYLLGQSEPDQSTHGIKIPFIEFDQLEQALNDLDRFKKSNGEERQWTLVNTDVSSQSFATQCYGQSMTPLFPEGSTLIFDKARQHYDGCYVLVHLNEHQKIVFKQLIIDEPYYYIKSINPLLKDSLTELGTKDTIIAILVQSQIMH